jgi:(2R)-ethylmalonyl-CoA mutase
VEEGVCVVGLSILSGAHKSLVAAVIEGLKTSGIGDAPVVVGGIFPPEDAATLKASGVAAVYTPKDFDLNAIMADIVAIMERGSRSAA